MNIKYNNPARKTLGPVAANFLMELYERDLDNFLFSNVAEITGLGENANRKLLQRMIRSGIIAKIKPGLYKIVPFELGRDTEYVGDPYILAREIIHKAYRNHPTDPYYISHGSALEIHQMITQPQMNVYATVCRQVKTQNVFGTEIQFVTYPKKKIFGIQKHWINKSDFVFASDLERTILDCLKMPQYCGGLIEVAKGLWIKRKELSLPKILDYESKLNVGAVGKRLGYLLDIFGIATNEELTRLRTKLKKTYQLLDPTLLNEGKHIAKWRLRLNISEDELKAAVRT